MMKKRQSLLTILMSLMVPLAMLAFPSSSDANINNYRCAQLNRTWTTWIRTPRGLRPLILWKNDEISGWSPQKRCIEVSKRMQRYTDNGTLNYIASGTIKGEPVICGVKKQGDNCASRNLIVTLPRGYDRYQAVRQLTFYASDAVLTFSSNDPLMTDLEGETYLNIKVLKKVLATTEAPVNSNQATPAE